MTGSAAALSTLETVLEEQKRALLAADFDALTGIPERLEQAIERLSSHPPPASDLARLAARAAGNAQLIEAARRGIARTRRRIEGKAGPALTTYDARGHRLPDAPSGNVLSRR